MNSLIISGQVNSLPKIHQLQDGKSYCSFIFKFKKDFIRQNQEPYTLILVNAWGENTIKIANKLTVGDFILVHGRVQIDEIMKNNKKKKIIKVNTNNILPKDTKNSPNNNVVDYEDYSKQKTKTEDLIDEENINLDNIPF